MFGFRDLFDFGNLCRVLIVALGFGFGVGTPAEIVQSMNCAVAVDCVLSPAEEPRERESLSLAVAGSTIEKQQRAAPALLIAAPPKTSYPPIPASPFGEARELRHVRGAENLPDKTGPPAA